MGYASYSADTSKRIKSTFTTSSFASTDSIFTSNRVGKAPEELQPKTGMLRECRDSINHPNSQGIAIFLDVTGSMGHIPEYLIRNTFDKMIEVMIKNGQPDAAILFGAIGDQFSDDQPLQVGQFESGTDELVKCLSSTYLEGGGGGQIKESYSLAWLIGARHTALDCLEKRGQKGFLFTVGDESNHPVLDAASLKKIMGPGQHEDLTDEQLLLEAQRMYNVFHIHVNEGSYRDSPVILGYWKKLLGERCIISQDYKTIGELIGSTVAVVNGANIDTVVQEFDDATKAKVKSALAKVTATTVAKGGMLNL